MFESLFAKTFAILGFQLLVTFFGATAVLSYVRKLYASGAQGITAKENAYGKIDLSIDWALIKPYFWPLMIVDIIIFIALLIFQGSLPIAMMLFTIWSIITGIEVALSLISVDENLGARVLGITVSATFVCALIAIYSGIDFSFLSKFLFIALLILLGLNIFRLFKSMERWKERIIAFFGVAIFIGYLLFDFNQLAESVERGENSWPTAMGFAINIYLDIINLFLQLLDALSD